MNSVKIYLLVFLSLITTTVIQAQLMLIRHANVLTMTPAEILRDYDIIIKDGKIISLQRSAEDFIPASYAKVIDASGQYILPGLIDMHVHLFDESELLTNLKYGVTTVLNMDGSPEHLAWREKSKHKKYAGARMFTAGHTLDGYPALNWMFWALQTPGQARAAVKKQSQDGYDFIKIYGTLNPEVFEAIQDEAKKHGMTVAGHVPRQVGIENAIKKNYSLIAHGDDLIASYFSSIPTVAQIDSLAFILSMGNAYLTPNLSAQKRMLDEAGDLETVLSLPENRYVSPAAYSQWIKSNNRTLDQFDLNGYKYYLLEIQKYNKLLTLACNKYGIKMLAGTDCATLGFHGSGLLTELTELVSAGLSTYEALHAATANAGEYITFFIDSSLKLGKIKAGYVADLILVNDNPLENILTLKTPVAVISKGMYYAKSDLDKLLSDKTAIFSSLKKRIATADSLIESADAAKGLKILKEESAKYPSVKIYAQWVLGIKAMRLKDKNPDQSFMIRKMNTELYPSHFSVYNELAAGYYIRKQFDSALIYLTRSGTMAPSNAAARLLTDKIYYSRKRFTPVLQGQYIIAGKDRPGGIADSIAIKITLSARSPKMYHLTYTKDGKEEGISSYEGGSDKIWFSIPGSYGAKEYSIWFSNQQFGGYYWGNFGNNGQLNVYKKQ